MGDYVMQIAEQELLKGQEKEGVGPVQTLAMPPQNTGAAKSDDMVHSQRMGNALKKIERMLNQNVDDEIFQDFKYWDDTSDAFHDGEGSLLPLWRFHTQRIKTQAGHCFGLESKVSLLVFSWLWILRLHAPGWWDDMLLFLEEHELSGVYIHHGKRSNVLEFSFWSIALC